MYGVGRGRNRSMLFEFIRTGRGQGLGDKNMLCKFRESASYVVLGRL